MGEPPSKKQKTLNAFFQSGAQSTDQNDDNTRTSLPASVTVSVSGNSITASATSDGATSSVSFSPTIILPSESSQRQENTISFPSDIAQSSADKPSQPFLKNFPNRVFGDSVRSFHGSWFQTHQWLEYSIQKDSSYCYPCRLFNKKPSESPFVKPHGYCDWKHAPGKKGGLGLHAGSITHSSAMLDWQQFRLNQKKKTTLPHRMDRLGEQTLSSNRHYIRTIAEIILLCARQEIALRGHNESIDSQNPGNFRAIFDLVATHDDCFRHSYEGAARNALYTSPDIQNQLATIMGDMVREIICTDVRDVVYYSLLVDESKDVSKKEQMSIMLRYVKDGCVHECFIGFVHASDLDAASLAEYISTTLDACSISLDNCISQCYDGASVMSGSCSGVQYRIRELAPCAIYTHCCAHRLNLVLVDCSKSLPIVREFLALLESLYVFMSTSKAHEIFLEKQKLLRPGKQVIELKRLIETRWACRHQSIVAVRQSFDAILSTLKAIVNGSDAEKVVQASGYLQSIEKFQFVVCLVIYDYIFGTTKTLSDALQSSELDLAYAICLISSVEDELRQSRSNTVWNKLWEEAVAFSKQNNISIPEGSSRRASSVPSRFDDCVVTVSLGRRTSLSSMEEYKCHVYFPIIDCVLGEMERRFDESNKDIMTAVQACSPTSKNYLKFEALKPLLDLYKTKLPSEESIKLELIHAEKVIKQANPDIKSNCEAIQVLTQLKAAFPGLLQLLNVVQTMAITTAPCERSFSSLKRIKTYLRSTMTDERLNSLSILAIERELSSDIDLDNVVDKFSVACNRRILL